MYMFLRRKVDNRAKAACSAEPILLGHVYNGYGEPPFINSHDPYKHPPRPNDRNPYYHPPEMSKGYR